MFYHYGFPSGLHHFKVDGGHLMEVIMVLATILKIFDEIIIGQVLQNGFKNFTGYRMSVSDCKVICNII